jgi:hypothetical protein
VQVPDAFAKGYCQSLVECCRTVGTAFDEGACEQTVSVLVRSELVPRFPSGYDFVPEAAAECVRDWSLLCGGTGPSYDDSREACSHLYRGHAAIGDRCSGGSDDCLPGLDCQSDAVGNATCQTPAAGLAIGTGCWGSALPCAAGAYCESSTMTCTALLPNGASCGIDYECQSQFCDRVCNTPAWPAALCAAPYVPMN